jgi:curved DNA binding protein
LAPGKKIIDLCKLGDKIITEELSDVYKNIKNKGVGYPTSISTNNMTGNFSPLDEDQTVLKKGDLVKIELGAHIDGYVAVAAETFSLEAEENEEKTRLLDALRAVEESLASLLVPGTTNLTIAEAVNEVVAKHNCSLVKEVNFNQVERLNLNGEKTIILRTEPDQKKKPEEFELEENEVYSINIMLSNGDGKVRPGETRTTVYQKSSQSGYNLKLKTSRGIFNEINHNFQYFPFTLRSFKDIIKARMGINELVTHNNVDPLPVLFEKPDKLVVQKRYVVILLPNKTLKLALESEVPMKIEVSKSNKDVEMGDNTVATPVSATSSRKRKPEASDDMEGVTVSNGANQKSSKRKMAR